jgi:hypothetical protein
VEILAVLIGVVLGGGAVAAIIRRRTRAGRAAAPRKVSTRAVDSFALGEPWRRHVASAQSAQRRFQSLVASIEKGPLRTRMSEIGMSVDKGVLECWEIAKRGDALDDTIRSLDPGSIRSRLERAEDGVARTSLQSQMESVERVRAARDDADARLRVLQTRLGELVSQAAEVSVGVDRTAELGSAVDDVVVQLEALRLAVREVANVAELPALSPETPTPDVSAPLTEPPPAEGRRVEGTG